MFSLYFIKTRIIEVYLILWLGKRGRKLKCKQRQLIFFVFFQAFCIKHSGLGIRSSEQFTIHLTLKDVLTNLTQHLSALHRHAECNYMIKRLLHSVFPRTQSRLMNQKY